MRIKAESLPKRANGELLIALILLLGFALRLWGIGFGLPYTYHADEPIVVNHALAYGAGDLNPHFFKIPPLTSYILFVVYGLVFLLGHLAGTWPDVQAFEHLFYADPSLFYLTGRFLVGVLPGTATVYLLYLLIRRYFGETRGKIGAFLMAVCFLHVRDSHYIYTDMLLLFVMVGAFFLFLRIAEDGALHSAGRHLLAGGLIGLAAAIKYNGVFLAAPYGFIVLMHCVVNRDIKRFFLFALTAGAAAAAAFIAFNPYALLDSGTFISELQTQSASNRGVEWTHHIFYSLRGALGLPWLVFTFLSISLSLLSFFKKNHAGDSKPRFRGVIIFFILFYYVILCRFSQPYDRYVLPLLPFIVVITADASGTIIEYFEKKSWPRPLMLSAITVLVAVLSLAPLISSICFVRLMRVDDVRDTARKWVEANIPAQSTIALGWDFYMPRLRFSREQLENKKSMLERDTANRPTSARKLDFLLDFQPGYQAYKLYFLLDNPEGRSRFLFAQPGLPFEMAALKQAGVEYVILARTREKENFSVFLEQLRKSADLIKTFSPYRQEERMIPVDKQPLTGGPFLLQDLLSRKSNGQPLEIYRIP